MEGAAGKDPSRGGPGRGWLALRRLLFLLEAETAHELGIRGLRLLQLLAPLRRLVEGRLRVEDPRLHLRLWDLDFPTPVGLAAGFDKDAVAPRAFQALGFGFLEVGTVTPRPQAGNPRPRLFRHPAQESLQNSLGFNNAGLEAMRRRLLKARALAVPLGVNLGKGRDTVRERAADDYAELLQGLQGLFDYATINVSSPNTPGLRDLQTPAILAGLVRRCRELSERPLLVKLAPDLDLGSALELGNAVVEAGAAGLILTNTTNDYELLPGARPVGGLSGRVLKESSFRMLRALAGDLYGRCVLVSVGGIDSAEEAYRRLRAGAGLLQLYTALVYRGPGLVRDTHRGLLRLLDRDRLGTLSEAIGRGLG